jgi:hypothetical protein
MLRKRLSVTSSFSGVTSKTSSVQIIQSGFDIASKFLASTRNLTPSGKAFTTQFAEKVSASDVEETHIVVTPVFYSGDRDDKVYDGDYFDACCLAYWQVPSWPEATQTIDVTLRGFSTIDFADLPPDDKTAVAAHLGVKSTTITCPTELLVVRTHAMSDVIPMMPPPEGTTTATTLPLEAQSPTKKLRVADTQPPQVDTTDSKGESPNTSKSKFIPDYNGQEHKVLETTNATKRRNEAEFMLRMLPRDRHNEMGLGVEYKLDPTGYKTHILELCLRDATTLSPDERCWESTAGLQYLEACPAFADDDIWQRFCTGEWAWNKVYLLSLQSFHRTGAQHVIPMDIDKSTLAFRVYLSECFEGLDLFLQAVCSTIYAGVFKPIVDKLRSPQNYFQGVSDVFLFYTLNTWMATICKNLRTVVRTDGSLLGPTNCRAYIVEQLVKPLTALAKVVDGDTKPEKTFASMLMKKVHWVAPGSHEQGKAVTPAGRSTRSATPTSQPKANSAVGATAVNPAGDYVSLCFHNLAEQLGLHYVTNKNAIVCKHGKACARLHIPVDQIVQTKLEAAIGTAPVSGQVKKQIKKAYAEFKAAQ